MNIAETYIAGIVAPLLTARRIYILRGVALVMLSTALVLSAGLLLPPLLTEPSRLTAGWRYVTLLASGLICFASLALVVWRTPSLKELARRADRDFALGERLSAFMMSPAPTAGPAAAIFANLAGDAARFAAQIKPAQLEPPVTRSLVLVGALQLAVLAFAGAAPHEPLAPGQIAVAPQVSVDADVRRESLNVIAEVLGEEAERRQDSYLAAVAEAVKDFARTADPGMDSRAFNKTLEGLLDHARLAYGKTPPAWLRGDGAADDRYDLAKDRNASDLARQATGSKPVILPGGGAGEEMIPELFTEHDAARNASVTPMAPGEIRTSGDPGDLKFQPQNVAREGQNGSAAGDAKTSSVGGSPPGLGKDDPTPVDLNGATAVLAGGATQSGAGASRVAGQGTADLNDPNQPAAPQIEQGTEQVLLPPDQYRQGKRIRMQMNPNAEAAGGSDEMTPGFASARRGEPAPVSRDTPSLRDQEMFSRVFVHEGAGVP